MTLVFVWTYHWSIRVLGIYVVDIATNQDEVGRAHREIFEHIQPAETMVGIAELAHPDMLVEIDVEALV